MILPLNSDNKLGNAPTATYISLLTLMVPEGAGTGDGVIPCTWLGNDVVTLAAGPTGNWLGVAAVSPPEPGGSGGGSVKEIPGSHNRRHTNKAHRKRRKNCNQL